MTSRLRLILLVLLLAASLVLASAQAFAGRAKLHRAHRFAKPHRAIASKAVGVRAVTFARHLLGVPYSWGGTTPRTGFDCSGFVSFVYDHFGITLPHSSFAQFGEGRRVSRGSLRPGDLVFFDGVGHVGLYIGGGRFIHAPHSGTRVSISSLATDSWYASRFDGARRLVSAAGRRLLSG